MANVRELHCFYVAEIVLSFCLFLTLYMYMYLHGRLSASVNMACCSSASPCVDGLPARCTSSCAAVLLPMKASCDAFLLNVPMLKSFATKLGIAASKCGALGGGGH